MIQSFDLLSARITAQYGAQQIANFFNRILQSKEVLFFYENSEGVFFEKFDSAPNTVLLFDMLPECSCGCRLRFRRSLLRPSPRCVYIVAHTKNNNVLTSIAYKGNRIPGPNDEGDIADAPSLHRVLDACEGGLRNAIQEAWDRVDSAVFCSMTDEGYRAIVTNKKALHDLYPGEKIDEMPEAVIPVAVVHDDGVFVSQRLNRSP